MSPSSPRFFVGRMVALWLLLALTLSADGLALAELFAQGSLPQNAVFPVIILALFMLVTPFALLANLRRLLRMARLARAALEHDLTRAPRSPLQADPAMALAPGETLSVTRWLAPRFQFTAWLGWLLLVSLVGTYIDAQVFGLTPTTASVALSGDLDPLHFVALLVPFVLLLFIFFPAWLGGQWVRKLAIHADDAGLTIHCSGQAPFSLAWADIRYCAFIPQRHQRMAWMPDAPHDGTYCIGNATRMMTFVTSLNATLSADVLQKPIYRFDSNVFDFYTIIMRVLATMQVRSRVEITAPANKLWYLQKQAAARAAAAAYEDTVEDPLEPPPAPALMQPRPDLVAQMKLATEPVVLRPRLRLGNAIRNGMVLAMPALLLYGCDVIVQINTKYDQDFPTLGSKIIAFLVFLAVVTVLGCWGGISLANSDRVTIIADADGITMQKSDAKRTQTLAWENVGEWVAIPQGEDPARGMRYTLRGRKTGYVLWRERSADALSGGGGHAAFQQRAEALHALIAAKTGLPLLELPYKPVKRRWWRRLLSDD